MQETNFDRLLHRYLHNELTPEESAKFSAWLDLLEAENARDMEMSPEAKEQLFEKITSNTTSVDEVVALYPRKRLVQRLFSYRWVQVAATVLVLLSVTLAVRNWVTNKGSARNFASTREKLFLNDGTIVWISEASSLSYYEKAGARFADFSGEALFEVAKNPNSPFTISCGRIHVKVLGTSFTLKADSGLIELNVLTGKVNVASDRDEAGVDVAPHEKIIYSTAGVVERTAMALADIASVAANSEYHLRFQGATMDQVIKSISRKFDVTITVKNKRLNTCHVSADFTDHSLEDTLSILADLLDITYNITGKQIELSGEGC